MVRNKHADILIAGIGNDILGDDGIGPKIIRDIDTTGMPENTKFIQATLGGMDLLDLVGNYDEVIFIDALKTGTHPPGTVLRFIPEDFKETLHLSNIHDIDFLTALELGRRSGIRVPSRINIIAVEIIEDRVFSNDFTAPIRERYPFILNEVRNQILSILG